MISATHVHLDHHHCLEVILARGPANILKRLADRLIGAKGVISGEVAGMSIVGRRAEGRPSDRPPAKGPPAKGAAAKGAAAKGAAAKGPPAKGAAKGPSTRS